MRRAFNLIELIFTIVIMAGIFAVIPKIVFATNKSDNFAIKQDALFNAISITNIASILPWDENNTENSEILTTTDNNIPCDPNTYIRIGGFLSTNARTCKESFNASTIGTDAGENDYLLFDDIDDFNNTSIEANLTTTKAKYAINTEVDYLDDTVMSVNGATMTINLDKTPSNITSNIKKFKATARYVGKRGSAHNIASFYYYSANIGQFTLGSEVW